MVDVILQIGLSNAAIAFLLAIIALLVGAKSKRPHLAHLLWLLVFVKLVTPPLVTIPIAVAWSPEVSEISQPAEPVLVLPAFDSEIPIDRMPIESTPTVELSTTPIPSVWVDQLKRGLVVVWVLGSLLVFVGSLLRVRQFNQLLASQSSRAAEEYQTAAIEIGGRLGLLRLPELRSTTANLSPMVWWSGGRVQVVIPESLFEGLKATEWHWVLAHELAHVRRRDYLVRWLEWIACVLFWWNPMMWWAQRNLRAMEEICCDALVISSLSPKPLVYANSILKAVESLACPVLRPPAMASEINSGGFLERRFKMIVKGSQKPVKHRAVQVTVLLLAFLLLPMGFGYGQDHESRKTDFNAVARRLKESVHAGEMTTAEAKAMLSTFKKKMGERRDERARSDSALEIDRLRFELDVLRAEYQNLRAHSDPVLSRKRENEKKMSAEALIAAEKAKHADRAKLVKVHENQLTLAMENSKQVLQHLLELDPASANLRRLDESLEAAQIVKAVEEQLKAVEEMVRAVEAAELNAALNGIDSGNFRTMPLGARRDAANLRNTELKLKRAVEAREIAQVEAAQRLYSIRREETERMKLEREAGAVFRIDRAVAEKNGVEEARRRAMHFLELAKSRQQEAIAANKLATEKARQRDAVSRQQQANQRMLEAEDRLRAIEQKLQEAVESGAIDEAEAKAKMDAVKRKTKMSFREQSEAELLLRLREQQKRNPGVTSADVARTDLETRLLDIARHDQANSAAAKQRLAAIHAELVALDRARKLRPKQFDLRETQATLFALRSNVKEFVEAGKISKEEAKAEMDAIREVLHRAMKREQEKSKGDPNDK